MEQEPTNKKKAILALTSVWTGAMPFFYEGKDISTGMPAFYNVFTRLIKDERIDKVHLILLTKQAVVIPPQYKDKLVVYAYPFNPNSKLQSALLFAKIIAKGIAIVKKEGIKQIVGFGSESGLTAIIGKLTGVPDFRRVFGSFLINEIKDAPLKIFARHPLEYLAFNLKGKGLLITNDGTKGDIVFDKIGHKKMPFHFPLNGVDLDLIGKIKAPDFELPPQYLSYVARVEPWKSQHLLIEALGVLKKENFTFPKLYIVGNLQDKQYIAGLEERIHAHNLSEDVVFINGLPSHQVHYVLHHSMITYSLYHTSNLGNVFLEAMRLGTPTIALNDTGSLNLIAPNAYYEILDNAPETIAEATKKLIQQAELRHNLSDNAKNFATASLKNWDERARYEINLILS